MNSVKIKELLKERGITITRLATELEVTRQTLYNKLDGKNQFTVEEIKIISKLLEVEIEEII